MKRVPWPTALSQPIVAVVLVDDAVGDRQAEAGAAADRLGREERIVDARQMLRRNARPGIGDLRERAIAVDPGRHRQPAAARHRITRVEKQVQEDLLQLMLDAQDRDRRGDSSRRTLTLAAAN